MHYFNDSLCCVLHILIHMLDIQKATYFSTLLTHNKTQNAAEHMLTFIFDVQGTFSYLKRHFVSIHRPPTMFSEFSYHHNWMQKKDDAYALFVVI